MKKLSIIAASALSLILFVSCKKDNPAPTPSVVGLWKGKYGNGPATYPNKRYAFLFRNDGTVRVYNNTDTFFAEKAEGTYIVTGGVVKTTYSYQNSLFQYSTNGFLDSHFTFMEGTWSQVLNPNNGGKFFVIKQ